MFRKGRVLLIVLSGVIACSILSFSPKLENASPGNSRELLEAQVRQLESDLSLFNSSLERDSLSELQAHFVKCRSDYKRIEFAIEYFFPIAAHRMNGAAVLESEPGDVNEVISPTGFQVIESLLFHVDEIERAKIKQQIDYLLFLVRQIGMQTDSFSLTPSNLIYSTKLNFYRLASKGLSGFDASISHHSLSEAAITLRSADSFLAVSNCTSPDLRQAFIAAITPLEDPSVDFESFDRAKYLSGAYRNLLQKLNDERLKLHILFPKAPAAIRPNAVSFYDKNAFDPFYFAPEGTSTNFTIIQLGKRLFNEKLLTQNGRTCASCHKPELAFTDGVQSAPSLLHGDNLSRNTPTLTYAALQPNLFWDGRTKYLEEQALQVLSNKAEMHGQLDIAIAALKENAEYAKMFKQSFPADINSVSESNIAKALANYIRTLSKFNSRFDEFMRGHSSALNEEEKDGFNLFMGKAQCGTCHYQPLFNGAVPPMYDVAESEVLGTPSNSDMNHPVADEDRGAFVVYPKGHKDHAFRTPTLRNVARTAPYMHNGVFKTLNEVVEFYDRGGGAGIGLPISNQTLSAEKLGLTGKEKKAIVAFLKAMDDV
jgi:cytochrome c peroxidase